jgi:hypothetical protein
MNGESKFVNANDDLREELFIKNEPKVKDSMLKKRTQEPIHPSYDPIPTK